MQFRTAICELASPLSVLPPTAGRPPGLTGCVSAAALEINAAPVAATCGFADVPLLATVGICVRIINSLRLAPSRPLPAGHQHVQGGGLPPKLYQSFQTAIVVSPLMVVMLPRIWLNPPQPPGDA